MSLPYENSSSGERAPPIDESAFSKLDHDEQFAVAVLRMNKEEKRVEIRKAVQFRRLRITFEWRSRKSIWGRFGGGWQWKLGVQVGWPTVILSCLVFSLRLDLLPPPAEAS